MRVEIVAGFDGDMAPDLPMLTAKRWVGVRRDIDMAHLEKWVTEFCAYPDMYLLSILRSAFDCAPDQMVAEATPMAEALVRADLVGRCGIEVGNEPNISVDKDKRPTWAQDPVAFRTVVNACAQAIWALNPRIDVVSGGVSNTGWKEQAWLARAVDGMHLNVVIGYHTYRQEDTPETPRGWFKDRDTEDAALRAIFGSRRRMLTEFGWGEGPWQKKVLLPGVPLTLPPAWLDRLKSVTVKGSWTEQQVAEMAEREIQRAEANGAECAAWYQIGGGTGIRRTDGTLKPVADVAAKFWVPDEDEKPTVTVSFLVVDDAGAPIDGVRMRLRQDDEPGTIIEARSDAAGRITFTSNTPGWGVSIWVERDGYDPLWPRGERRTLPGVSAMDAADWKTVLRTPVAVLVVVDGEGRPVEGATVLIEHDGDGVPPVTAVTDGDGDVLYVTSPKFPGWGAWITIKKEGLQLFHERYAMPMVSGALPPAVLRPIKKRLPPVPTRDQVCKIRTRLQGLTYHTRDYGDMPGPFFWSSFADRETSVYPEHRKVGDTHLPVGVSGSYNEPNTIWPPEIAKGGDITNDLQAFKALLREVITEGFFCDVPLSGDGQSVRTDGSKIHYGEYNDKVGSTYGYDWVMQNLPRILKAVRGDADSECPDGEDLTPWCIFRNGWDGVFGLLLAVIGAWLAA